VNVLTIDVICLCYILLTKPDPSCTHKGRSYTVFKWLRIVLSTGSSRGREQVQDPKLCNCVNERRWVKSRNQSCLNLIWVIPHPPWRCGPTRAKALSFLTFLHHTQRRTTVSRTPLDEWSDRRRDPYLTTYTTNNRQTSMPLAGFEPTISASERPQAHALDRAATGTG
jgi:hypothetical protein